MIIIGEKINDAIIKQAKEYDIDPFCRQVFKPGVSCLGYGRRDGQ